MVCSGRSRGGSSAAPYGRAWLPTTSTSHTGSPSGQDGRWQGRVKRPQPLTLLAWVHPMRTRRGRGCGGMDLEGSAQEERASVPR
jgi:hypothetical protein